MLHVGGGRRCMVPYNGGRPGLLDIIPGASTAVSLRRMRRAYKGPCVNVRRSSDNASQDIGFTALGDFNISAFLGFIGAGNGFVTKGYDQSGNGRNLAQATAANQPQLILNKTPSGKPALIMTGSQQMLSASFASSTSPQTLVALGRRTANFTTAQPLFGSAGNNQIKYTTSTNTAAAAATAACTATASDSAFHSLIGILNGTSSIMNVDGVDTAGSDGADNVGSAAIFAGANTNTDICEAISYGSLALSSAQRSAIHANQAAYWGTP